VEPLVSAVYAADMKKLSISATLSRFRDMEREHGSLIRAMRLQAKQRPNGKTESGARYSMFVTLSGGLSSLVAALAARLPQGAVHLQASVSRIERREQGWRIEYSQKPSVESQADGVASSTSHHVIDCDGLVLATPAHVSALLLQNVDGYLAAELAAIEHSGTAIVSLGYDRADIGHKLDGMGVCIPAIENSPLLACSFSSQKYPHRAPAGKVLLRVFVGGARRPELAEMPDAELLPLVLKHLEPLLEIRGKPCYVRITHWPRTMPQYHLGHAQRVERILARLAELPGLQIAGNALRGVGIPDCIHSGQTAADRVAGEVSGQ
jgi:oxygen-dependent protoporphyrinogen oxidase